MTKFLILIIPIVLYSCNQNKGKIQTNNKNLTPDTLFYNIDSNHNCGIEFSPDTLTKNFLIPRKMWLSISIKGKGCMNEILKHSHFFLENKDTNYKIRKKTDEIFEIYINDKYSGFFPEHGGECLVIYSVIQPKKGYVLKTYFLDEPIKYPQKTQFFMHYIPIEEN